ncbi:hypothetical protein [Aquibacillus salsiterrae]|uniref:Uncharacterized protein n=1 Tax=Aquibacillus salsiterrae TaxID=2950439 RepID=A0A9X4AHU9_9BACI|nr:hypothetical protein [Aquibacillus salsiterrae]MDC3418613.1 hypothetical protein [Aquibacillus salsiterrae]
MQKNITTKHHNQFFDRSISIPEIRSIYQSLLSQYEDVSDEIEETVDRNDYVKLSHLLVQRSKIQSAIENIESIHEDDLATGLSFNGRIARLLNNVADITQTKGEDVLDAVTSSLERMNQSAQSMATKATSMSTKTFDKGNQLSHQAGTFLVHKTSKSLAKLADTFQKRS